MKRVLVVDDDSDVVALMAEVLGESYEIQTAADGQAGYEKALQIRPDIVITDIMMPKMHGYELCQRLKSASALAGVKVMVVSSKGYPVDIRAAQEVGADGYLLKPFTAQELQAAIESVDRSEKSATVRFWGTRGSCAAAGPKTARYGGNTSCVEARMGGTLVILDCGTGIRELGLSLEREFQGRPIEGHIFVGHTHWDHIQGFPFFVPLYDARNSFKIYSLPGAHGSLERVFSGSMASDYFPVPLSSLSCRLEFVEVQCPLELPGGVHVSWHALNHPGGAAGFRFEAHGKVLTYLSDHENFAKTMGDTDAARRQDAGIAGFVKDSDLLISEAQYTEEEYPKHRGWGHSTYDDAVRCALAAGAKQLAVFHHDPERTDDMMDVQVEHCRELARKARSDLACCGAKEGLSIIL